jgi:PAS domain S-box-containing protein
VKIDLRHFEAVCNNATAALLIMDAQQHCVYMNPAAEKLTGFRLEEMAGRRFHDVVHHTRPDGTPYPIHDCPLSRALPERVQQQGEDVFVHRDGHFYDVAYTASPIREADGLAGTVLEVRDISERKRREAALRETSERYQLLSRATNDVIWDWDLLSDRLQWSEAALKHFGCSPESLGDSILGWEERIHPDDHQRVVSGIQAAIDGSEQGWSDEYRFRIADGSYGWFLDRGLVTRDESGKGVRMIGSMQDISERLRFEANLLESEHRYRKLADSMPHLVWTAEADGRPDYYNARAERYRIIRTPDGSWDWQTLLHEEDRELTAASWRDAVANGTVYSCEHRLAMADGSYRWHLSRGEPAHDASGAIVKWFGTATDIQQLRESEARFGALADHMSQLAWMADEQGNAYWYNRRWIEYTGKLPEDMLGHGWKSVHHPDQVERVMKRVGHSIATDDPLEDIWQLRGQDGSYRWFLARALPIRGASGRLSWFGTATDITTQREAEDALREADRRKDEFLSMLAHELRNPLAPIRNALHILDAPQAPQGVQQQAREIIDRQLGHMVRLVDDLLDVSRIVRGRIELRMQDCDLCVIAQQTLDDYRQGLEAAGLQVSLKCPGEGVAVRGDPTRLAQVVGNVLHNAAKFTPAGGRVEITLQAAQREAELVVEDTGVGIEPALLRQLFTPFRQADQGLARLSGGLGLGLSLVKGLIELHGGFVQVSSPGRGGGTRISMHLPLAQAPEPASDADVPAPALAPRSRLLVIEDNRDSADTMGELMGLLGHAAQVAYDGESGLALMREQLPDAVICDIGLEGSMDGHAVARAVRADPATAQTQLIALSGYGQAADIRRSLAAGFDLHLVKPLQIEKLQEALADHANRRRQSMVTAPPESAEPGDGA